MNLCTKTSQFVSMGYIFKCSKNAFYGLTIHPFDRISKKLCGEMVLSGPPWPSILSKNCRLPSCFYDRTRQHSGRSSSNDVSFQTSCLVPGFVCERGSRFG